MSPRRKPYFSSSWSLFRGEALRSAAAGLRRDARRPRLPAVERLEARELLAASVFTDKLDYAPGQTALFNGTGFAVGEAIQLQVTRTDGQQDYAPGNQPWMVVDGGDGDLDGVADGNF